MKKNIPMVYHYNNIKKRQNGDIKVIIVGWKVIIKSHDY